MENDETELGPVGVAILIRDKLVAKYGNDLDKDILGRVNQEMDWFGDHLGLEWLWKAASFIQGKREAGEYIIPRLFTNNSFLLYLLGATTVNPLPSHRYCPHHHVFSWVSEENACPECGEKLIEDGFDLDFAFFAKAMSKKKVTLDFIGTCEGNADLRIRFVAPKKAERAIKMAKYLFITQENLETNVDEDGLREILRCIDNFHGYYYAHYAKRSACVARPAIFVGLPDLGNPKEVTQQAIGIFRPQSLSQLADLFAGLHGRGAYDGNFLFLEPDSSPTGFAFSCETLLRFLAANEVDKSWALRIIGELRRNCEGELSKESEAELRALAWPEDYIDFIKGISYLFYKGHEVAEMRLELRLAEVFLSNPTRYYEAFFFVDKETLKEAREAYCSIMDWYGVKTELSEAEIALMDMMERGLDVPKILGC